MVFCVDAEFALSHSTAVLISPQCGIPCHWQCLHISLCFW